MALVIKKWQAGQVPDAQGNYVHLVGREAGLLAWFLSIIHLDPTMELEVKKDLIVFQTSSLAGREKHVIPMRSISSAYYGFQKPWKISLLLGIALMPVFFIGIIVGPLYYFLNKTLAVGVVEISGSTRNFAFKRSIIEGQSLGEEDAYRVIEIIRFLVEQKTV